MRAVVRTVASSGRMLPLTGVDEVYMYYNRTVYHKDQELWLLCGLHYRVEKAKIRSKDGTNYYVGTRHNNCMNGKEINKKRSARPKIDTE